MTNPESISLTAEGDATVTFYLKDGQYIKIPGLPEGYGYTLTEDAEDYASSATISATNGKGGVAYSDPATGSNVAADIKTGFTNDQRRRHPHRRSADDRSVRYRHPSVRRADHLLYRKAQKKQLLKESSAR